MKGIGIAAATEVVSPDPTSTEDEMLKLRTAALARSIRDLAGAFEGAVDAASAVRLGRKPSKAALARLGIAHDAFDGTGLR